MMSEDTVSKLCIRTNSVKIIVRHGRVISFAFIVVVNACRMKEMSSFRAIARPFSKTSLSTLCRNRRVD